MSRRYGGKPRDLRECSSVSEDIVKRLRAVVPYQGKSAVAFLCHEAADEIDRLRQHRQAMVNWLRLDLADAIERGEHLEAPSHE